MDTVAVETVSIGGGVLIADDDSVETEHVGAATTATTVSVTSLSQRCPNPACMGIIEQANAYVLTKLAGRLSGDSRQRSVQTSVR